MIRKSVLGLVFSSFYAIYAIENGRFCHYKDVVSGMCVPANLCPKKMTFQTETTIRQCNSNGNVCCKVSEKIVTPLDGNNLPLPVVTAPTTLPVTIGSIAVTQAVNPTITGAIISPPTVVTPPSNPNPSPGTTDNDSVVISAEDLKSGDDFFEGKCREYNSRNFSTSTGQLQVMIIGGVDAGRNEFPHMAALGYGDQSSKQWLCGGSLVSENYVVTAAHCLSVPTLGEVRYIKLGTTNLEQDSPNVQEFTVSTRSVNPNFNGQTQYNDIALLRLNRPATITDYVSPVCILTSSDYQDKNLIATGWGRTEFGGQFSVTLKKVGLELFTQAECQSVYQSVSNRNLLPNGIQDSSQICAGSRSEERDTCQGDSGGPLQIRKNDRWYLIGITSFGIECGTVNIPGVYTRVSSYTPWIRQTVWALG